MLLCQAGEEQASFHAYKRIGAPHCAESGPTLCPIVDESTRNDSHGQQGDSSIHKSPRGRALGTAAEHSETAVMLGAHTLALHQSSVHPRDRPALVGLAAERERLEGLGLSQGAMP